MGKNEKEVTNVNEKADRGEQILAAAYTIFGKKGFYAAKMDDIAQAANVAKGTLYLYYANKEELFRAVIEKMLQDYFEKYAQILKGPPDPFPDKLTALARHQLYFIRDRADFAKISMKEGTLTDSVRQEMARLTKKARTKFIRALQAAYPGRFDEEKAYLIYLCFSSMGDGMTSDMFLENRELTEEMVEERARFVTHILINGLKPFTDRQSD